MNKETLLEYIEDTESIEFISDESVSKSGNDEASIYLLKCDLKVNEINVPVKILVTKWFPEKLPLVFLEKYDALGFLPHIEPNAGVCYLEKESVYVNTEAPKVVFQATIELVIETLSDGIAGVNAKDFREEFHVFWQRNNFISSLNVMSFIDFGREPAKVKLLKTKKSAIVFNDELNIDRQKEIFFKKESAMAKSGIFIPIDLESEIVPPKYDERWGVDELVKWLRPKVSKSNWKLLEDTILNNRPERFEYLIIGIPRETGATLLVGIQFRVKKNTSHPLLTERTGWGMNLLKVTRLDNTSLLPRGGANIDLQAKSVLLVGCGSVGSHLALTLAKTGIGHLGLVDDDTLKLENVQRFAIGLDYSGKKKVKALEEFLKKNYLGIKVSAYDKTIENVIDLSKEDILNYDVVVSATGNPTINLFLNKWVRKHNIPFIVGWNEPLGIGGHSQISIPNLSGCYRCLYRDRYNISSFAARKQPKPFHKKHLGCGEVFTPYSALDSSRTSVLMTTLIINFLTENIQKPEIISWKGDSKEFLNAGFKISDRYSKQTTDEMTTKKCDFINDECPHCNA